MKKSLIPALLAGAALAGALLSGCGKTQGAMTPKEQASFGHYGQPMPAAARQYMQQHPPGGTAAGAQSPRPAGG